MCDVNFATGEVTQFEYDVVLPGRIPWTLIRRYTSIDAQPGLLGYGWRSNLGTFLREIKDKFSLIVDGEEMGRIALPIRGARVADEKLGWKIDRVGDELKISTGAHTYVFSNPSIFPVVLGVVSVRDYYGNSQNYAYDAKGRLCGLVDSMGRRIHFEYDGASRLIAVMLANPTNTSSLLIRFAYNDAGDLAAAIDSLGNDKRYEYQDHLLTRVTFRDGRDLFYTYDRARRCRRTWFTGGVWDRQLSFDKLRHRVLVTDPLGFQTLYKLNKDGIPIGDVDSLGRVREDVTDEEGRVIFRVRSKVAPPELIRYDRQKGTVFVSQSGKVTQFVLDANERPVTMIDPLGNEYHYEYDEAGNDIRSESPSGAVWKYAYNSYGDLVKATAPNGYERFRELSLDRLAMHDRYGSVEDARLDVMGRVIAYYDALGVKLQTVYDACGNPILTNYPDGTCTKISFDGEGNPVLVTDELGRVVRYQFNGDGTQLDKTRPDGRSESFWFNLRDDLIQIRNAKGEFATLEYDGEGRCVRIQYFDDRVEYMTFDDNDQPIELLAGDSGNRLVEAEYEGDQLIRERFPDGRVVEVAYGPLGELVALQNSDVTVMLEWDGVNQVTRQQVDGLTLDFCYDLSGNCTSVSTNTGRRIEYQWDLRARLTQVVDSGKYVYAFSFNALNLITEYRMPNGCTQHFEYDVLHRMVARKVVRYDGSEICSRSFTYDAAGRLVGWDDSRRGRRVFKYNVVDFLESVSDDRGELERYLCDANGNLLATRAGDVIAYARGDRVDQVGNAQYKYDQRGNLVGRALATGDQEFSYTGESWLAAVRSSRGDIVEFQYDAIARRISKTVNGNRTNYYWNGVHLLGEARGGVTVDYLFLPGSFFVIGSTQGGRHYSYVTDHMGTPTEVLDDAGEIVWSADYSAYGEVLRQDGQSIHQPFRFLGQYHDPELGLHYTRYRYYDPIIGRFTCPDPIGLNGGLNQYGYAPNPINWVDPVGLVAVSVSADGTSATCEILGKCSWGPKTMEQARKKVRTFNSQGCKVDMSKDCDERESGYKEAYIKDKANGNDAKKASLTQKLANKKGESCKNIQVDHIKDVQCGGENDPSNLQELVQTVNSSFGSQTQKCLSRLPKSFKGTLKLKLVDRNTLSEAGQKKHGKKPCEKGKKKCP